MADKKPVIKSLSAPIKSPENQEQNGKSMCYPQPIPRTHSMEENNTKDLLQISNLQIAEIDDVTFIDVVDQQYECPICMQVLNEPLQTQCGHRFCTRCIEPWIEESGNKKTKCPSCNEILENFYPDTFAKRKIQNFLVRCSGSSNGCDVILEYGHLQDHIQTCQFVLIICPQNCERAVARSEILQHMKNECPFRQVSCVYCSKVMTSSALQGHHEGNCEEYIMECAYCNDQMPRDKMKEHHSNVCKKHPVKCKFYEVGCKEKILRDEVEEHSSQAQTKHLESLLNTVKKLKKLVVAPKEWKMSAIGATENMERTSKSEGAGTRPKVHMSEEHLRPQSGSSSDSDNSKMMICNSWPLGSEQQQNKEKVEEKVLLPVSLLEEFQQQLISKDNNVRSLKEKNSVLSKQVIDMAKTMHSMELRLDEVIARCSNGDYIFELNNYWQQKHEAAIKEQSAIYSPGFYSRPFGYKFCIRVNLTGVDLAANRYMSIFIHLMKGDYDQFLAWPFQGNIKLSILDQSDQGMPVNISETLLPKPNLEAFLRPTSIRNQKGYGYVEYVKIKEIENPLFGRMYIKKGTVCIRATVIEL